MWPFPRDPAGYKSAPPKVSAAAAEVPASAAEGQLMLIATSSRIDLINGETLEHIVSFKHARSPPYVHDDATHSDEKEFEGEGEDEDEEEEEEEEEQPNVSDEEYEDRSRFVHAASFSPDGRSVAAAGAEEPDEDFLEDFRGYEDKDIGWVREWSITKALSKSPPSAKDALPVWCLCEDPDLAPVTHIAWRPDGGLARALLTSTISWGQGVFHWPEAWVEIADEKSREVQHRIRCDRGECTGAVGCMSWSTRDILAIGSSLSLHLFDLSDGVEKRRVIGHRGTPQSSLVFLRKWMDYLDQVDANRSGGWLAGMDSDGDGQISSQDLRRQLESELLDLSAEDLDTLDHEALFAYLCTMDAPTTEGQGKGKKLSKKRKVQAQTVALSTLKQALSHWPQGDEPEKYVQGSDFRLRTLFGHHVGSSDCKCHIDSSLCQMWEHTRLPPEERKRYVGSSSYGVGCSDSCKCSVDSSHCPCGHFRPVTSVSWSPLGQLASGSYDTTCKIWDVSTGKIQRTLKHPARLRTIGFSLDGALLACAGGPSKGSSSSSSSQRNAGSSTVQGAQAGQEAFAITLWHTTGWTRKSVMKLHTCAVWTVAWGPRRRLASGDSDGNVVLWNANNGEPLRRIRYQGHDSFDAAVYIQFAPDPNKSGTEHGTGKRKSTETEVVGKALSKTFKNSNFKAAYATAKAASEDYDLLSALSKFLITHCKTRAIPEEKAKDFLKKVREEAVKVAGAKAVVEEGLSDVAALAQRLWTSVSTFAVCDHKELCGIINEAIRTDLPEVVAPLAIVARTINLNLVSRRSNLAQLPWPPQARTFRGGALPQQHVAFYQRMQGNKYRVPGFFATSFSRDTATEFAQRAYSINDGTHPAVIFVVMVDAEGATRKVKRCRHVSLVRSSNVPGETEFLYAPYSVFTVQRVQLSDKPDWQRPHEIHLHSVIDNLLEEEDLPLAPWY